MIGSAVGLSPGLSANRGVKIPISPLLRGELRPRLADPFQSPTAMDRSYFRPTALRWLVEKHVWGRRDHGAQFWTLLMLELWHRQWLQR